MGNFRNNNHYPIPSSIKERKNTRCFIFKNINLNSYNIINIDPEHYYNVF